MEQTDHITSYYERLHARKQHEDFSVQEEINWIMLNGDTQSEIIDWLLCFDATLNMDIDKDSSKTFKEEVRRHSRSIYRAIKKVDQKLGEDFLKAQDKE
jgi:hypothetical protein